MAMEDEVPGAVGISASFALRFGRPSFLLLLLCSCLWERPKTIASNGSGHLYVKFEMNHLIERLQVRGKKREKKQKERPALMWKVWEEENDMCLLENHLDDLDLDIQNMWISETAELPSDLILPLLRYQKEWLAWALKQETIFKGGILAEELGTGKMVQFC